MFKKLVVLMIMVGVVANMNADKLTYGTTWLKCKKQNEAHNQMDLRIALDKGDASAVKAFVDCGTNTQKAKAQLEAKKHGISRDQYEELYAALNKLPYTPKKKR